MFEDINKGKLNSIDLDMKKKHLNENSLMRMFKSFNLNGIFSDKLILTVIKSELSQNFGFGIFRPLYFKLISTMLFIYQEFLEKINSYKLHFFTTKKNNDFNSHYLSEKKENSWSSKTMEQKFIISFFKLQTIDDVGFQYKFGCLENECFIDLVKLFHEMFPSFALDKIYSITTNQYLKLAAEKKNLNVIKIEPKK